MNNTINKFLLAGDKFMPEMHLRQPGFTYSACGPFTKHKERITKFEQTGDTQYIYRNELDKACFQHDAAYADNKDLLNRTRADQSLRYKAYGIANNPQHDGYQRDLASMVYKFFDTKASSPDRKTVGSGTTKLSSLERVNENIKLANELHKPIIRKVNKRKVYSSFKDNIWGADLADMQLLSKFNKGIKYLLCVIDLFSKYAFVVPLKDKKGISIVNAFQSVLSKSKGKPNKIWVDKGSEFYNTSFKKWLQDNDIVMYSMNNEGKSVVAERFIRTLKRKIYKYMTSVSKNVYIDKLNAIVNKYKNTYHTALKMKPINVKDNTYINTNKEINYKDPKFKVGDYVRISKYKNIFAKGYMLNWIVKNTVPWTYVIKTGTFYENGLQKTNQKEFRIEKVIKQKGDKLYVKWKGYDNSFNSWINKNDIIK